MLRDGPGSTGAAEVLHWYDFVCPFCYLAQADNEALEATGVRLVEHAFNAHPEIPPDGTYVGPRSGAMYVDIERRAELIGLPLDWPHRLPNTRLALGAAEWVAANDAANAAAFRSEIFAAHFAEGEDIGRTEVVLRRAEAAGVASARLEEGIADGSANRLLRRSETLGRSVGVSGTPAWLIGGRLVSGLQPVPLRDLLPAGRG